MSTFMEDGMVVPQCLREQLVEIQSGRATPDVVDAIKEDLVDRRAPFALALCNIEFCMTGCTVEITSDDDNPLQVEEADLEEASRFCEEQRGPLAQDTL